MNPAQCDETLLILYEEKFFFVLGVAIIRPGTLLGDENMGNGEFIPHLSKEKNSLSPLPGTCATPRGHSCGKLNIYTSEGPSHPSKSPRAP